MTRNRGMQFRIYPNKKQEDLINKTFGCCRFVYNTMLDRSKEEWKKGNSFCTRNQFDYELTDLKKEKKWLREVDSTALTSAMDHLATSYKNYFEGNSNEPKHHKRQTRESYTSKRISGSNNIAIGDNYIKLPKLKKVKAKIHRKPGDGWILKSATIFREAGGEYYVAVLFEIEDVVVPETHGDKAIGLDYSSTYLYVDDHGNHGSNHKYYKKSQKKLAKAQKKLARKKKGSKNYMKQKLKKGKIDTKIKNQRKDHLHKLSTEIANQYDIVCVETLNMIEISNRRGKYKLGKSTMDNGYGMFCTFLAYKMEDRGKTFVKVDRWYPSTQLCSSCGYQNPLLKDLSIKKWDCPKCGVHHDRDTNAAINIRNEGLRLTATLV